MKFQLTFFNTGSFSGSVVPYTGLTKPDVTFVKSSDGVTVVDYDYFSEIGKGQYVFGTFDVPEVTQGGNGQWTPSVEKVLPRVASNIQQGFSEIPVWNDVYDFVTTGDFYTRADKLGDEIYYYFTYNSSSNFVVGFDPINGVPNDQYKRMRILPLGYYENNFVLNSATSSFSGSFVTTNTSQNITGEKTFYGGTIFDIQTSEPFQIRQASNPPNGGVASLDVTYGNDNKSTFQFYNSYLLGSGSVTFDGISTFRNPRVPTNSQYYANPSLNSLVSRNWVVNNFVGLGSGFQSNTVIVDPSCGDEVSLKYYPTINAAMSGIVESGQVLSSSNVWTVLIYQNSSSLGYQEDIEVPDYMNLIGVGAVNIVGNLTRTGGETTITSKLQNLTFIPTFGSNIAVDRLEAVDCVFSADNDVVLTSSIVRNCGLFGTTVSSAGGNTVMNCFGNYDIIWNVSTDNVFSYDIIIGSSYPIT